MVSTSRPTSSIGRPEGAIPESPISPSTPGSIYGHRSRPSRAGSVLNARNSISRRESILRDSSEADLEARAEAIAALEDLKARLAKTEDEKDMFRKEAMVLSSRLEDTTAEQARLEEKMHEYEEQIEQLSNAKREASRQMREMENIYEGERSAMTREKEEMADREEEMQAVIQRLKNNLSERHIDDETRPSRANSNSTSPTDAGGFAPPSSLQRSDSRNNSKILLQKDKLIENLRLELAEAHRKLKDAAQQGDGRFEEMQQQLVEARMANARLTEENESWQLLMREKTLNGEFTKDTFDYTHTPSRRGSIDEPATRRPVNEDTLAALEGRSTSTGSTLGGTTLADELDDDHSEVPDEPVASAETHSDEAYRNLESELRNARDQNKALTLYINKIIERLLQHQEFEAILDQSNEAKKEAARPKEATGPGWLQRTKSIMSSSASIHSVSVNTSIANTAPPATVTTPTTVKPKRPRPMSIIPTAAGLASLANDPDRVPIGNMSRSSSVRRARPRSEQFTASASLVNQMYRGLDGQMSPTFNAPRRSQTFFASGALGSPVLGPATAPLSGRMSSNLGNQTPSVGNFPGMRSETSSVSNESLAGVATPPSQSSPPRSLHEKMPATTFAGNKPRPLRLVQDHNDAVRANKRSSWLPWGNNWGSKVEDPEC